MKLASNLVKAAAVKRGGASVPSDPYYENTVFLSNYLTDIYDKKGHVTTAFGNAAISGGNLVLDGAGDYVSVTKDTSFNFGTGDWCLEIQFTPTSISAAELYPLNFCGLTDAGAYGNGLFVSISNAQLYCRIARNGIADAGYFLRPGTYAANKVYVVVVSCISGTVSWYAYEDGVQLSSANSSYAASGSYDFNTGASPFNIGRSGSTFTQYFIGSIDFLRITKGVGRGYTGASITLPTSPLPEVGETTDSMFSSVILLANYLNGETDIKGNRVTLSSNTSVTSGKLVQDATNDGAMYGVASAWDPVLCSNVPWTIEVKRKFAGATDGYILAQVLGSATDVGFMATGEGGKLVALLWLGSGTNQPIYSISNSVVFTAGVTYEIVIQHLSNHVIECFINGSKISMTNYPGYSQTAGYPGSSFVLGGTAATNGLWIGCAKYYPTNTIYSHNSETDMIRITSAVRYSGNPTTVPAFPSFFPES